ncbi:hypothetical protein [Shewanella sp. SR44-3]|uniref:hypothetical protein n=1 Tax=Shewanella sp. SR44-3 TaxID=2760936 RepID=UPI0015FA9451|nr:hypothetical protein [Shewanella sp. SR44-3]MBB1271190.1 hypothetical protein [Shewanella sp. SR44-3]
MKLTIESKEISWTYEGVRIQPSEVYEALGATYDENSDKVLVLCGERGVAQELMIFDTSGNYIFSLGSPKGYFQHFTFSSGSAGVACGYDLQNTIIYKIDYQKQVLE